MYVHVSHLMKSCSSSSSSIAVGHVIMAWGVETLLLIDVLSALFLWESNLCLVMKLRNSEVVLLSSASVSLRCDFQFDAHQNAEVSYCRVSMDSTNVS